MTGLQKFLLGVLVLGFPGLAAAAPSPNAFDLFLFGSGPVIVQAIESIKQLLQDPSYVTLFRTMALAGFILAVTLAAWKVTPKPEQVMSYLIVLLLLEVVLFQAKVDLYVQDPVNEAQASAGTNNDVTTGLYVAPYDRNLLNVPMAVALPALISSTISYGLTDMIESFFTVSTSGGGGGVSAFGLTATNRFNMMGTIMRDMAEVRINEPQIQASMAAYTMDCFVPELFQGNKNPRDMRKQPDLWDFMEVNNQARLVPYYAVTDATGNTAVNGELVSCSDAHSRIEQDLIDYAPGLARRGGDAFVHTNAYNFYNQLFEEAARWVGFGQGAPADEILRRNAVLNTFSDDTKGAINPSEGAIAFAVNTEEAKSAQRAQWRVAAEVFMETIGYLYVVLQVFIFSISPIIFVMLVIPGIGKKIVGSYMIMMMWIALWQPLLSIVNFMVTSFIKMGLDSRMAVANTSGTSKDFVLSNIREVSAFTDNITMAASFMATMVPMVALGLLKGGSIALTQFTADAVAPQASGKAAANIAAGNLQYANKQIGNSSIGKMSLMDDVSFGNRMTENRMLTMAPDTTQSMGGEAVTGIGQAINPTLTRGTVGANTDGSGTVLSNTTANTFGSNSTTQGVSGGEESGIGANFRSEVGNIIDSALKNSMTHSRGTGSGLSVNEGGKQGAESKNVHSSTLGGSGSGELGLGSLFRAGALLVGANAALSNDPLSANTAGFNAAGLRGQGAFTDNLMRFVAGAIPGGQNMSPQQAQIAAVDAGAALEALQARGLSEQDAEKVASTALMQDLQAEADARGVSVDQVALDRVNDGGSLMASSTGLAMGALIDQMNTAGGSVPASGFSNPFGANGPLGGIFGRGGGGAGGAGGAGGGGGGGLPANRPGGMPANPRGGLPTTPGNTSPQRSGGKPRAGGKPGAFGSVIDRVGEMIGKQNQNARGRGALLAGLADAKLNIKAGTDTQWRTTTGGEHNEGLQLDDNASIDQRRTDDGSRTQTARDGESVSDDVKHAISAQRKKYAAGVNASSADTGSTQSAASQSQSVTRSDGRQESWRATTGGYSMLEQAAAAGFTKDDMEFMGYAMFGWDGPSNPISTVDQNNENRDQQIQTDRDNEEAAIAATKRRAAANFDEAMDASDKGPNTKAQIEEERAEQERKRNLTEGGAQGMLRSGDSAITEARALASVQALNTHVTAANKVEDIQKIARPLALVIDKSMGGSDGPENIPAEITSGENQTFLGRVDDAALGVLKSAGTLIDNVQAKTAEAAEFVTGIVGESVVGREVMDFVGDMAESLGGGGMVHINGEAPPQLQRPIDLGENTQIMYSGVSYETNAQEHGSSQVRPSFIASTDVQGGPDLQIMAFAGNRDVMGQQQVVLAPADQASAEALTGVIAEAARTGNEALLRDIGASYDINGLSMSQLQDESFMLEHFNGKRNEYVQQENPTGLSTASPDARQYAVPSATEDRDVRYLDGESPGDGVAFGDGKGPPKNT